MPTISSVFLWAAYGCCGAGILLALLARRAHLVVGALSLLTIGTGVALLVAGGAIVAGDAPPRLAIPSALPFGPLAIGPDALGAFFLAVIGLVCVPVGLYSWGYLRDAASAPGLRAFASLWFVLAGSLVALVTAADGVLLLVAWEVMAVVSYLLVNFEHDDPDVRRAAFVMLAVSEVGTFGIVAALLALWQAGGSFDYAALRAGAQHLAPGARDAVFLLALFGFGAKAGILPLQLWLPEAHPAAPSNLSALLSAVIIKMGIYGIIRLDVDVLGPGPGWWGLVVLLVGAVTAVIGILYATVERDLKRLLAYSSIENVGLICVGIGAAMAFRASSLPTYAAIVGIAALYHVVNHAAYKSLLFLAAGAVDRAVGTRDLERLGGIMRRLPWTGASFLIGALAISAVPPLNGYVSEWMLLESLLRSSALPSIGARVVIAAGAAAIALTAGIAVFAFARAVGCGFLGMARSEEAARAREVGASMRAAMAVLVVACVGLGTLPTFVIPSLNAVTASLFGVQVQNQVVPPLFTGDAGDYQALVGLGGALFGGLPVNGLVLIASPKFDTITAPSYLALVELLLVAIVVLAVRAVGRRRPSRRGPVWAGGISVFTSRMEYTGTAYANPVRMIFQGIFRSWVRIELPAPVSRHQEGRIEYRQEVPAPLERELYRPVVAASRWLAARAQIIQSGNINQYVGYILLLVLAVLIVRARSP